MKTGIEIIGDERARQISKEGWTPQHDDGHHIGELCSAAACYLFAGDCLANAKEMNEKYNCTPESLKEEIQDNNLGIGWPWEKEWLKIDADPIRSLAKAGALIAAEIDRLNRVNLRGGVVSAVRDEGGWCLFNNRGGVVEEWPADWPESVNRPWLESLGIKVAV